MSMPINWTNADMQRAKKERAMREAKRSIEDDRAFMRNYMNTPIERWASLQVCDQVFEEFYGESREQKAKHDLVAMGVPVDVRGRATKWKKYR